MHSHRLRQYFRSRGSRISWGAPAAFLRSALEQRDVDLVRAFLAGKMSVDDAALVRDLIEEGLCVGPVYLPEWFIDIDRLNAIATHSVTMNRFSLPSVTRYYARRRGTRSAREAGTRTRELDTEEAPGHVIGADAAMT